MEKQSDKNPIVFFISPMRIFNDLYVIIYWFLSNVIFFFLYLRLICCLSVQSSRSMSVTNQRCYPNLSTNIVVSIFTRGL